MEIDWFRIFCNILNIRLYMYEKKKRKRANTNEVEGASLRSRCSRERTPKPWNWSCSRITVSSAFHVFFSFHLRTCRDIMRPFLRPRSFKLLHFLPFPLTLFNFFSRNKFDKFDLYILNSIMYNIY